MPEELLALWQAHERWERAVENASLNEAEKIWSHEDDVTGIDSLGLKALGWKEVRRHLKWGFAFVGPSEMVSWNVVVSVKEDKGSVTGNYIWKGILENKIYKATELYRKEEGVWKLYYDDGLGNHLPLFPDEEKTIKRLFTKAKLAYLKSELSTLEELFAPSHRYINYLGCYTHGLKAGITALGVEQDSIDILQFDDSVIFLWRDGANLKAEVTFQLRYNYKEETKNTRGSLLFEKQKSWKLVLTNLFGNEEKENPAWDVNCDAVVDISDLVLVGTHFGEEIPSEKEPNPDVNRDGKVDILDLVLVGSHFGEEVEAPSIKNISLLQKVYNQLKMVLDPNPNLKLSLKELERLLVPSETVLLQNYPNPFNPETWIPFKLSDDANVVISIYDIGGQLIRKIGLGEVPAGMYLNKDKAVYWDGKNSSGEKVSSGLYFYQLRAGDYSKTKRMLIMK